MTNTLRLDDNPALVQACATGNPVIPVYILDEETEGTRTIGGARRWWLREALTDLSNRLDGLGSLLIVRKGRQLETVADLIEVTNATAVYLTRGYEPWTRQAEADLYDWCQAKNIECRRFGGNLLLEPEQIQTKTGKPYQVFTPFWRAARQYISGEALEAPERILAPKKWPASVPREGLDLAPKPASWADHFPEVWDATEAGAHDRLEAFIDSGAGDYVVARDKPGVDGTSRLSPYLAHGQISARRIFQRSMAALAQRPDEQAGIDCFVKEVGWREFSAHLLFHFPHMPKTPLKAQFEKFPWQEGNSDILSAWQQGLTGFPIVDAGMRQLWKTGWMHNRVRMIVASFLVKDMLWHWRDGEAWFWDTLVDADPASNSASWQWVAGCGADAAPYFRIFNPILQGEKFDKAGDYIREFVPELSKLPNSHIHKPFEAPPLMLREAGIVLGEDYPVPILDRAKARARALAALKATKD
ncbi:MAG: deoxyribodipyrimidine photo-lyase [Kordiimonas sp.]